MGSADVIIVTEQCAMAELSPHTTAPDYRRHTHTKSRRAWREEGKRKHAKANSRRTLLFKKGQETGKTEFRQEFTELCLEFLNRLEIIINDL